MKNYNYKLEEVYNLEYKIFLRLLDMTKYHKAEHTLTELRIQENNLLLKSKKTADKYNEIYKNCSKELKEVIRTEYTKEQLNKNTDVFIQFLKAKGGVRR